MAAPVRRQTNTSTGVYWLRQAIRKAQQLGKAGNWRSIKDGYLLWAARMGKQRTATLVDLPPRVRVVGNIGGVPGLFFGSPLLTVGGTRDAFHPGFGVDPQELDTDDIANAQSPEQWQSVFITSPPAAYGIFMGEVAPTSHNLTRQWFGGASDSTSLVQFYPLERPLYVRAEFIGRSQTGTAVVLLESVVQSVTGGYAFSTRDVDTTFTQYPLSLPYVGTDYDPAQARCTLVVPVCKTVDGKLPAEWGVDYGRSALFVARITDVGGDSTATAPSLVTFPGVPQFEQPEWLSPNNLGYTPCVVRGEAVLLADGTTVYYGTFDSFVYPSTATQQSDFENMQTRFRLEISSGGAQQWSVLSCVTSGAVADPDLDDREVNAPAGGFWWSEPPIVFDAGGSTWGVWTTYELGAAGFTYSGGGRGTPAQSVTVITRDGTEVARGNPAGSSQIRNVGQERTVMRLPTGLGYGSSYVACHLDQGADVGFSFFVWDETTDALRLAKWDTVGGFGYWVVDLSAMNTSAADRLPSISVYNTVQVVENEVVGVPSFMATAEYGGVSRSFVIANGVAKALGNFGGLNVVAVGNQLQTTPLSKVYRR